MRNKKGDDPIIPAYRRDETTQEKKQRKRRKLIAIILTIFVTVGILRLFAPAALDLAVGLCFKWNEIARPYYYENRKNWTIEEWKDMVEKIPPPDGVRVLKVERDIGMGYDANDMQYTKYVMAILIATKLDPYGKVWEYYNNAIVKMDLMDSEFDFTFTGVSETFPQARLKSDNVDYKPAPGEDLFWIEFVRSPDPDHWWQVPKVPTFWERQTDLGES